MQKSSSTELLFCYALYLQNQGILAFYSLAMTLPNTCFLTELNFDIAITARSPMLKSLSLHCDEYVIINISGYYSKPSDNQAEVIGSTPIITGISDNIRKILQTS